MFICILVCKFLLQWGNLGNKGSLEVLLLPQDLLDRTSPPSVNWFSLKISYQQKIN